VGWNKDGVLSSENTILHLYEDTLKISSLNMNNDNLFTSLYLYSYNSNNKINSEKFYQLKIEILSENDREFLSKSVVRESNKEKSIKYEYNEYHDVIKIVNSEDKIITTFQYKYDTIGNWVQKIVFTNEKPIEMHERFIIYL